MKSHLKNTTKASSKVWRALYIASRQEKKVTELLKKKGIEAYIPLIKTMRQWSDRKKMVEFPLLNGYVFAHITSLEQERTVQTKGVVNFVRAEGKIATVRDHEIEQLKQLIELGYQMEVNGVKRNFKEGDRVRIASGALKNIEGFVLENKEGRFIEVVLESIGQSIKVKLPEEIVLLVM
jgi:transcription antitermination factor NusG